MSKGPFVRLACLRHAASVHPEPGSNSPKKNKLIFNFKFNTATQIDVLLSFQRTFLLTSFSKPLNIITDKKRMSRTFPLFFIFFAPF